MITTIQLNENVKNALNRLKADKETYEEVIMKLMKTADEGVRTQEQLLIAGCKAMADENLKITNKFENIENLKEWEW